MPLLLTESDVKSVLAMADLIDLMEAALAAFSAGRVAQPVRGVVPVAPHAGFMAAMTAYLEEPEALGVKVVTVFHHNVDRGWPSHLATILLHEPATGRLLAIMDGRYITEARTAAVSAAATRRLAREDARTLAILGSGVQARSHLEAIRLVRPLERVRVFSPTAANRRRFADEMSATYRLPVEPTESAEQAVRDAAIVVTATSSQTAVLDRRWLAPGTHINAVGACRPDWRELDTATVASARVFVDSRSAAMVEAGDLLLPMKEGAIGAEHIAGELGELFAGRIAPRAVPPDLTLFKSLGLAVEDVATARLVYDRATERRLGTKIVVNDLPP